MYVKSFRIHQQILVVLNSKAKNVFVYQFRNFFTNKAYFLGTEVL